MIKYYQTCEEARRYDSKSEQKIDGNIQQGDRDLAIMTKTSDRS